MSRHRRDEAPAPSRSRQLVAVITHRRAGTARHRANRRLRPLAALRELALCVGALAGTLCLAVALLGATVGVRPLVFTSGSMAPTIGTGDLAFTRPVAVDHVAPGDVVSVIDARGARVTHRVVAVDTATHLLRLRGDANAVEDPLPYAADQVDRVVVVVPAGGTLLAWFSGPTATLLLGAYLVFLLRVLWPRNALGSRARVGSAAAGLLLVVGLAVAGAPAPERTLAAWTDAVPVTGTTYTAYTVPKPVISCSPALGSVTVSWTGVSAPYALTYTAVVVETGQALAVTANGTTRSVRYVTTQLSTGSTQTIQVTAALPSTPSWASVPAYQPIKIGLAGLLPSCGTAS